MQAVLQKYMPSRSFFRLRATNYMSMKKQAYRIEAGKLKTPQSNTQPSITSNEPILIQADQTGHHFVAVIESCRESQCGNRQCDTTHSKICEQGKGVLELVGNLSHTIPKGKEGIEVSSYDINGQTKHGSQKLITEKTTVPVDHENLKKNEKATEFVQQHDIAEKIRRSLPKNSPVNLKNTSESNSPFDNE